jgi:hypothetical protein
MLSQKGIWMDRRKYYVVLYQGEWWVNYDGERTGPYKTQALAMDAAKEAAKKSAGEGYPSQVLVQGRDNQWQVEWTYGDDPYPPKG